MNGVEVWVVKMIFWDVCVPEKADVTFVEVDDPDSKVHDWK